MTTTDNERNAFQLGRDYQHGVDGNLLTIRCPEGCDTYGTPDQHDTITSDENRRIVIWHGQMFGPVSVNVLQTIGLPGYDVEITLDDADFKSVRNGDAVQALAQLAEDVTAARAWAEGLISQ